MILKKPSFRFSLRALMAATTFAAVAVAAAVKVEHDSRVEQELIAQLESKDVGQFGRIQVWPKGGLLPCGMGLAGLAWTETVPGYMESPCESLGFNSFVRVTEASIWGDSCNDQVLDHISQFRHLRKLTLDVANVSVSHLERFRRVHPKCLIVDGDEPTSSSNNPTNP